MSCPLMKNQVITQQQPKKLCPFMTYAMLHLIFLFFAITFALQRDEEDRVVHLVLAMAFSPFYVIAHLTNLFLGDGL